MRKKLISILVLLCLQTLAFSSYAFAKEYEYEKTLYNITIDGEHVDCVLKPVTDGIYDIVRIDNNSISPTSVVDNTIGRLESLWSPGARALVVSIQLYGHETSTVTGTILWYQSGVHEKTTFFSCIANGNTIYVDCPLSYKKGCSCGAEVLGVGSDGSGIGGLSIYCAFTM